MLRQNVTDQEIRAWVYRQHGLKVELGWIANCKVECGIPIDNVRAFQQSHLSPCPPEIRPAIKQAFRHFGMLSSEA